MLLQAVVLLDLAHELIAFAGDDIEFIVGELASSLTLSFPVPFDAVPVHVVLQRLL